MSEKNEVNSIAKSIFLGELNESDAFPFPHLSREQVEMGKTMVDAVNKFAQDQIDAAKFDRESAIPDSVLKGLAELGLCGLAVGEEYGGLNLDYSLYARVFSEVAGIDGAIATTLGAHQSIGYKALVNDGNEAQKKKWLPKLASGEVFAAFCLTEPGSGSDAYSIKTKAVKNNDGTYTINGQKLWITNGGKAGFYSVFCKTEHDNNGKKEEKISCFIVEKEREGISFGEKEDKMGIRASETRAVYFDNVKIPAENMIGEPGKGFKIAMNVLNTGRLSLGSGSVGGMKAVLKMALGHAKNRKQFDRPIAEFGMVQEKLATIAANIYVCESMVYMTTGKITQGMSDYSMESAMCKVFCSEKLWESVDKSMQIAAGNGYMREYPYERIMRDSRINLIFEGTNEILRVFLALSGIKDSSDKLKELGKISDVGTALQDPIKSLGVFGTFAKSRLSKMMNTKLLTKVHPDLEYHAQHFSEMLNEFSIKVENVLIKFGKKIIGTEMLQHRLANMGIELYAQLAMLSRTTAILEKTDVSEETKAYVKQLTSIACWDSRQIFMKNAKRVGGEYDKLIPQLSESLCKRDEFGLDILDY